ncbi:MAG TPA: acyl-CoA dehydrogenase family protein [Acidobacteriota bacterium]|nr:acyl-CoA dehydrogenase family protein [Acidobacteriota bacterium]
MEYFFTEDQKEIQQLAKAIADGDVRPAAAELDEKEEFPRKILDHLAKSGLLGVYLPEEHGGFGGGITELCIVTEELSRACVGVSTSYAANALGVFPIIISGSEEQKKKYLPPTASGESLLAFCLTESEAGSDATAMKTTAVKDGDEWVLNGTKQWITNGGEADIYSVIAVTEKNRGARGISAFVVENGTPGLSFGAKEKKLGIRCSSTREVIFEDCRIPAENILGRPGTGLMTTVRTLDRARVGVGAQAVGLAAGALDYAINYARQRRQFGQTISSFQSIQHMLADMATRIEAARALVYMTALNIDKGVRSFAKEAAMAKYFASDVAMQVTIDAVQIFGGYGYMREYPVEKMLRDAKILQIYEGTNQIQRNTVALALIKEAAKREE